MHSIKNQLHMTISNDNFLLMEIFKNLTTPSHEDDQDETLTCLKHETI
jgi:hypothetical protein